jgi:hypothetical protein
VLLVQVGDSTVQIGVAADNVLKGNAPPQLVRHLLEARLQSELRRRSSQGISESEVDRDWKLLQQTVAESPLATRSTPRLENVRGNHP